MTTTASPSTLGDIVTEIETLEREERRLLARRYRLLRAEVVTAMHVSEITASTLLAHAHALVSQHPTARARTCGRDNNPPPPSDREAHR